jgi:hypothetical protein
MRDNFLYRESSSEVPEGFKITDPKLFPDSLQQAYREMSKLPQRSEAGMNWVRD